MDDWYHSSLIASCAFCIISNKQNIERNDKTLLLQKKQEDKKCKKK